MSRRYLISLLALSLVLVLAAFAVQWFAPQWFLPVMPLLALYFGIVAGAQHWIVTRAMHRSPRAFVQIFLGSVTAVLFLHLAVLIVYVLSCTSHARPFLIAFCIGYAATLVFETVALVQFVRLQRKNKSKTT